MAQLTAALDDEIAGRGRLVMLVGEPGIGKTRLAEELASVAVDRHAVVVWGRCREQTGAPPYWPWIEAFRSILDQFRGPDLAKAVGVDLSLLAQVLPELGVQPGDSGKAAATQSPEAERFRLFSAMVQLFKAATKGHALLVIL